MSTSRIAVLVMSVVMVGVCGLVTACFIAAGSLGYASVMAVFGVGGWSFMAGAAWLGK